MIDTSKRKTLKRIGITAATAATLGVTGQALAGQLDSPVGSKYDLSFTDQPLADIKVETRVSALTNDLEVLITNTGDQAARITQMTPSETVTSRGRFDFGALMKEGDLTLARGQSVSVPMRAHAVAIDATNATVRARSLNDALRHSFSVITENDAFARVSVSDGVRFV